MIKKKASLSLEFLVLTAAFLFSGNTPAESSAEQPDPASGIRGMLAPTIIKAHQDLPSVGSGVVALATDTSLEPVGERLSAVFQRVPGLIAQDSFGGFDPPRLAVRGSGIQSAPTSRGLLISFFDMPLSAADGSFNLSLLESSWMKSARLTRGPAAGVPSLGGSLMLGSASDLFDLRWSTAACYGSNSTLTLSAGGAQQVGDAFLAARVVYNRTDGWRPHSSQERVSFLAAIRTALNDNTELTIQFFGSQLSYDVPGPLTKHDALFNPESNFMRVLLDRPRRETEYGHLHVRVNKRWADARASLAIGGVSNRDTFYQLLPNGISDIKTHEAYLAFDAEKDWCSGEQQTRVFVLLHAGWWDARRYRSVGGEKGSLIGHQRLEPFTLTASLDHRWNLPGNQKFAIGASLLSANRDINDRLGAARGRTAVDLSSSDTRLAPRASWSWSPLDHITVTASWARSYEPPTYNDLIFTTGPMMTRELRSTSLAWQQADSFEIGAQGRCKRLDWSASVYYAPWKNEFLRLVDATGSPRGTVNADRTIHSGFEGAVEWDLLPDSSHGLSVWATYNYTNVRFNNDPVYGDNRLGGVPPHTGAIGLRAVSPSGWFVTPSCQWRAGDTYGDHAHGVSYGSAGIWSLELGRRHPDGWAVTLGVYNLFDSKSIASTAGVLDDAVGKNPTLFLPNAGRTVELRVEYTW